MSDLLHDIMGIIDGATERQLEAALAAVQRIVRSDGTVAAADIPIGTWEVFDERSPMSNIVRYRVDGGWLYGAHQEGFVFVPDPVKSIEEIVEELAPVVGSLLDLFYGVKSTPPDLKVIRGTFGQDRESDETDTPSSDTDVSEP